MKNEPNKLINEFTSFSFVAFSLIRLFGHLKEAIFVSTSSAGFDEAKSGQSEEEEEKDYRVLHPRSSFTRMKNRNGNIE